MSAPVATREAMAGVALSSLKPGQRGWVQEADLQPRDAAYLRAMGLRRNAMIRVARLGHPCIVEVLGGMLGDGTCCQMGSCRIGLAREIAERVRVVVV